MTNDQYRAIPAEGEDGEQHGLWAGHSFRECIVVSVQHSMGRSRHYYYIAANSSLCFETGNYEEFQSELIRLLRLSDVELAQWVEQIEEDVCPSCGMPDGEHKRQCPATQD